MWKQKKFSSLVTIWLAIAAVLMMALAPSVSRALPSHQKTDDPLWLEICSVHGKNAVTSDSSDPFDEHTAPVHCPYCLVHGDVISPSRSDMAAGTFFSVAYLLTEPSYRSAPASFAWTVASSRAPPAGV